MRTTMRNEDKNEDNNEDKVCFEAGSLANNVRLGAKHPALRIVCLLRISEAGYKKLRAGEQP